MRSLDDRFELGRSRRESVPRSDHGDWAPPPDRRDPVAVLRQGDPTRLAELLPIRFGRMLASPFSFLRGSAVVMAGDLATTPRTGFDVQCCGDAHLMNFGFFATPERDLVFGLNDFDETRPGPWEWDLKRLVASLAGAARSSGLGPGAGGRAVAATTAAYRTRMAELARLSPLEIWYDRVSVDQEIGREADPKVQLRRQRLADKARRRNGDSMVVKLVQESDGRPTIVDQPPLVFHPEDIDLLGLAEQFLATYRSSLPRARAALLDRYTLRDAAVKVVGVGSVGTRCFVLLLTSGTHALLLQVKEAGPSVLEPHLGPGPIPHAGERIVAGQHLMQPASDLLLGWGTSSGNRHFYVRQLRDMKLSVDGSFSAASLRRYGEYCARSLARAHANTGDPAVIAGYLGRGRVFDDAMVRFSEAYADQTEQDHRALQDAERDGVVEVRDA